MFQKIKRIAGIVGIVIFAIALIYVLVARISGNTPTMFGYSMLRVSSESMEPVLDVGNIILVKEADPALLKKGDVITYKGERGPVAGMLITHQISADPYEKDGVYYFTTRGIKPGAIDDPEIDDSQIVGKVLCKIPILGTLYDFFSQWYGLAAFAALMIIAFSSEIMNLIDIIRNDDDSDSPRYYAKRNVSNNLTNALEEEAEQVITDLDNNF